VPSLSSFCTCLPTTAIGWNSTAVNKHDIISYISWQAFWSELSQHEQEKSNAVSCVCETSVQRQNRFQCFVPW
jgi:hypothetical protein